MLCSYARQPLDLMDVGERRGALQRKVQSARLFHSWCEGFGACSCGLCASLRISYYMLTEFYKILDTGFRRQDIYCDTQKLERKRELVERVRCLSNYTIIILVLHQNLYLNVQIY